MHRVVVAVALVASFSVTRAAAAHPLRRAPDARTGLSAASLHRVDMAMGALCRMDQDDMMLAALNLNFTDAETLALLERCIKITAALRQAIGQGAYAERVAEHDAIQQQFLEDERAVGRRSGRRPSNGK